VPNQGISFFIDARNDKCLVLGGVGLVKRLNVCASLAVIFFVFASIFVLPVFAQNSAGAAIASAQNSLESCYKAVEQAQAAGANVDSLVATLNDAAGSLSEAQLAYASGDYSSAYNYASQSQSALNGVTSEASTLQANADNSSSQNSLIVVLSLFSSVVILGVGVGGWVALNKRGRTS